MPADCIASRPFDKLRAGSCKQRKDGAPAFILVEEEKQRAGSASDGSAQGITYISGSRIFSALEVAADVFSSADVGQQLVELRRRAL
jgi:hypothetical protein